MKQQKGRSIPIQLQNTVVAELEKLTRKGHVEMLEEVGEEIFASRVVVSQKSNGSVKKALDAVELHI